MAIAAGLVGLPNVGKSTLFNALTKSSIPAENYPFCTVEPHVAITSVPDKRLEQLAGIFGSQKIISATMQFVDIAGLVKGASAGEGLGNQFLSHVMAVDLVLHVMRCFEDSDITHVHNKVDPLDDFDTISSELMLKDLESLEKRSDKIVQLLKGAKNKQASAIELKAWEREQEALVGVRAALEEGNLEGVQKTVAAMNANGITTVHLLSAKNFLVVANLSEDDFAGDYESNPHFKALVQKFGRDRVIPVSAKIESELAQLDDADATEMMETLGITTSGLDSIIRTSYDALGLITFYTCGPKEAHAWSIRGGASVPAAAGTIHSDMERGFICAEVYNARDLIELGTEKALKDAGKSRTEGKEYVVADGDLLHIRFNV